MKTAIKTLALLMFISCFLLMDSNATETFKPKKVAILVYDGVYLLDFCGPLEIFNDAMANDSTNAFEVFLVSPEKKSIKAHTNSLFTANYSIDDCPQPDILVIPGGNLKLSKDNDKINQWIKSVSANTEITMSVCTGAFILADCGLLDNLEVTTWYGAIDRLKKIHPLIKTIKDKRFTDNGKIITTAGISAGIDGSLHVVSRLFGKETALRTAKYIEYDCFEK